MLRATATSSTSSSHGGGFISEDEKKEHFIESYASTIALKSMLEDNEDAKMRVESQFTTALGIGIGKVCGTFTPTMCPFAHLTRMKLDGARGVCSVLSCDYSSRG